MIDIDADEKIYSAIKDIGVPVQKHRYTGGAETYVVFYTYSTRNTEFGNDRVIMQTAHSTVSIYSKDEQKFLKKKILAKLCVKGFRRVESYDVYNEETGRIQTIMEFIYEGR